MASVVLLGFSFLQYGDRYRLNEMPFDKVQELTSDPGKARSMAKQGNIDFFVGTAIQGKAVTLTGELTDANCYLAQSRHGYDHAFCARYCAAAGSPLVFLPDQDSKVYFVIPASDGGRIPRDVLDRIGIPGTVVHGHTLSSHGIDALTVDSVSS
jgi:hypothetical protein